MYLHYLACAAIGLALLGFIFIAFELERVRRQAPSAQYTIMQLAKIAAIDNPGLFWACAGFSLLSLAVAMVTGAAAML